MDSFSVWHWLAMLVFLALPAWLFSIIVFKAGFSRWLALWGLVPVVNIVALWLFAFSEWPKMPRR